MLRALALALRAPSRRTLEVALLYLIRRDNPSSKEGIKIHHYSGSSPTINVGQRPLAKAGSSCSCDFMCKVSAGGTDLSLQPNGFVAAWSR